MATIQVSLTQLQIDELCHKATVIHEEADLQDSYEISENAAFDLKTRLMSAKAGVVELPDWAADVLVEELGNCIEIADDNVSAGDLSQVAYRTSMRDAIQKIKAAANKETT